MNITCPQCGFSRNVPKERFSGSSIIAVCPKCSCRFRVLSSGAIEILPPRKDAQAAIKEPSQAASGRGANGAGQKAAQTGEQEEDIRVIAAKAYEKEAERQRREDLSRERGSGQTVSNPWEEAKDAESLARAFIQTALRVMFSAPAFFKNLNPAAPLARPLVFYLLMCVFQIAVERIWGQIFYAVLSPGATGDPQMEKLLAMLAPETGIALSLLLRGAVMVAELYLFSFAMSLAYRVVAPGRSSFSLLFQILAYSSAPAVLCVIPAVGSLAGLLWGLGCLAVGCKTALELDWGQTFFGFLPIILIFAPLIAKAL